MNKYRRYIIFASCLLVLAYFAIATGCGTMGSVTTSSSTPGLFYNNATDTTPVFEPLSAAASAAMIRASEISWESGNSLYSVFWTLREYLASRDEGIVDRSNLYKLLLDVDTGYTILSSEAQAITQQTIVPPFSQLSSIVCNKAYNDESNQRAIALKDTTEEVQAVQTWILSDAANKAEYGIAVLNYNKLTQDITVEMTYSVDYDTSDTATEYNLRCFVEGNPATNSFQFKYIIGNTKIVAKGVSQGEGNYMLFKYAGSGEATKYIVVPAGTNEAHFQQLARWDINILTDPASLPATVAAYKDWVTNEAFFESSNLVTDISTLNSGNSKEGTIYLDYN